MYTFKRKKRFNPIKLSWRSFVISMVITFSITSLHLLGILPTMDIFNINREEQKSDIFPKIKSLLEEKKNDYSLKHKTSFIPGAYASPISIDSSAFLALDVDSGEVLAEKNLSERLPIASLTKIMTAVVALDLAKPSDEFVVTKEAAEQIPTKIGVVPGEKMSLEELLNASLLTSANDAVEVIREGVNEKYNEKVFIKAMNEKAKIIGLKNTSFENPQGFDDSNNYSSAEDLAILSYYALNNYPLIKEIVRKDYQFIPATENHKQFDLQNWNGLIDVYPGVVGFKIGNTDAAGKTTVVLSQRNGRRILAVVLGAPDVMKRDLWAAQLLDYGYSSTLNLPGVKVTPEQLQEKYNSWQYWN